jgi:hypothetical protein
MGRLVFAALLVIGALTWLLALGSLGSAMERFRPTTQSVPTRASGIALYYDLNGPRMCNRPTSGGDAFATIGARQYLDPFGPQSFASAVQNWTPVADRQVAGVASSCQVGMFSGQITQCVARDGGFLTVFTDDSTSHVLTRVTKAPASMFTDTHFLLRP